MPHTYGHIFLFTDISLALFSLVILIIFLFFFFHLCTRMHMAANYKVYRELMMQLSPPAVPFVAPFLSDLTFVDENPKELQGMINFGKCRLVSD